MGAKADYFQGGLTGGVRGAATGAALGSLAGPGPGTAIGGVIGGGLGVLGGLFQARGNRKQKAAMDAARKQLQELSRQQYASRMKSLGAAMDYFKPVDDSLERLYGAGAAGPDFDPSRFG